MFLSKTESHPQIVQAGLAQHLIGFYLIKSSIDGKLRRKHEIDHLSRILWPRTRNALIRELGHHWAAHGVACRR